MTWKAQCAEAAERIEELELEVETWKSRAIHQNEVAGRLEAKLSESEALLAKAMEALEKVQAFVRELEPYAAQGTTLVPALREACDTFIELSSVSCANLKGDGDE